MARLMCCPGSIMWIPVKLQYQQLGRSHAHLLYSSFSWIGTPAAGLEISLLKILYNWFVQEFLMCISWGVVAERDAKVNVLLLSVQSTYTYIIVIESHSKCQHKHRSHDTMTVAVDSNSLLLSTVRIHWRWDSKIMIMIRDIFHTRN